jgi:hypothetical protein
MLSRIRTLEALTGAATVPVAYGFGIAQAGDTIPAAAGTYQLGLTTVITNNQAVFDVSTCTTSPLTIVGVPSAGPTPGIKAVCPGVFLFTASLRSYSDVTSGTTTRFDVGVREDGGSCAGNVPNTSITPGTRSTPSTMRVAATGVTNFYSSGVFTQSYPGNAVLDQEFSMILTKGISAADVTCVWTMSLFWIADADDLVTILP